MRFLSVSHGLIKFLVRAARAQRVRLIPPASRLKLRLRIRLVGIERGVLVVRDIVVSSRPRAVVGARLEGFAVLRVFVREPKSGGGVIQAGRDGRYATT